MKTGQKRNCVVVLHVATNTSIACTTGNRCKGGKEQLLEGFVHVTSFCHREYWSTVTASKTYNCSYDCTVSQKVRAVAFDVPFLSVHFGRRHQQLVNAVSGLTGEDQWH